MSRVYSTAQPVVVVDPDSGVGLPVVVVDVDGAPIEVGGVFEQSAVAVSHTGDTNLTVLKQIVIPGGLIGPNGQVEIEALFSANSNTNNKNYRIYFGSSVVHNFTSTNQAYSVKVRVSNRNNEASQVTQSANVSGGFGNSTSAVQTLTIDTTNDFNITLRGSVAVGTDTVTLESYIIKIHPGA